MFDKKKDDNSSVEKSVSDVFRPAKGNAKVIIGDGVSITGEIKKADEVQIDGEADVTMKTDNLVIGTTGNLLSGIFGNLFASKVSEVIAVALNEAILNVPKETTDKMSPALAPDVNVIVEPSVAV